MSVLPPPRLGGSESRCHREHPATARLPLSIWSPSFSPSRGPGDRHTTARMPRNTGRTWSALSGCRVPLDQKALPAAFVIRRTLDDRLLRMQWNQAMARRTRDGLRCEEPAGVEPEEIALEVHEYHDGGPHESIHLPARDRLLADMAGCPTIGGPAELGSVVPQAQEFP